MKDLFKSSPSCKIVRVGEVVLVSTPLRTMEIPWHAVACVVYGQKNPPLTK